MFARLRKTLWPSQAPGHSASRDARRGSHAKRHIFFVAALAFTIVQPTLALAGTVYGTVTMSNNVLASKLISFKKQGATNSIRVRTDENGRYRIVLPKGTYTAEYGGKTVTIRSHRGSIRQDIEF